MAGFTLWLQLGENMSKLAKPSRTARLVQSKNGWYVLWYSEGVRYRMKNGINTISSIEQRLFYANRIVSFINMSLQEAKPVRDVDLPSTLFNFTLPLPVEVSTLSFLAYFQAFIERLEKRNFSFLTIRKHKTLLFNLRLYAENEGKEDFCFQQLDKNWVNDFKAWRFAAPNFHHINYVSKDLDIIRRVIGEAESEDDIKVNAKYKSEAFKLKKIVSDEVSLTLRELEAMWKVDLSGEVAGIEIVRDDFVLACYTGIRWGNWKIAPSNIIKVEGRKMLKFVTEKNYTTVLIPLHPTALGILEKYDFNIRPLSNQKTNKYIKRVAELAGITDIVLLKDSRGGKVVTDRKPKNEEITTHTARRSFVTIGLVEWKIPPQYIMQITGHKTERQLYEYARVDKNRAAVEIAKIFENL